jgi:hypothetical protein
MRRSGKEISSSLAHRDPIGIILLKRRYLIHDRAMSDAYVRSIARM